MSTITRLFNPAGKTALTPRERAFLRDLDRFCEPLEVAMSDMDLAIDESNVEAGLIASRRLLAIGLMLGELARTVDR